MCIKFCSALLAILLLAGCGQAARQASRSQGGELHLDDHGLYADMVTGYGRRLVLVKSGDVFDFLVNYNCPCVTDYEGTLYSVREYGAQIEGGEPGDDETIEER